MTQHRGSLSGKERKGFFHLCNHLARPKHLKAMASLLKYNKRSYNAGNPQHSLELVAVKIYSNIPTYTFTIYITGICTHLYTHTSICSYNIYNEVCRVSRVEVKKQFAASVWFSFCLVCCCCFFPFSTIQTKPSESAVEAGRASLFEREPGDRLDKRHLQGLNNTTQPARRSAVFGD